ncbi:immunogenic protein P37 [Borreliella valaisiana]|uniref:immunogenic protein P37 n=2 Tax=Borreliella valaisiana TaxID=62088 RepID=UPI001AED823C|nr:immunogenic protein P37 [Borreliella valaisiana]
MNLMIKEVLMISSLFCSFISCKLYEAIDKSQQALAIQDLANNKSLIKDNKRSGRKARSISYKEVNNQEQNNENNLKKAKESKKDNNLGIQKDGIVNTNPSVASDASEKHTNRQPQQVNNNSRETSEARNIIQEISTSLEEVNKITTDLETIKQILDNIESLLNTANSYLENARKAPKSNQDNQTLLLSLHQAIAKVKSSHASFIICYNDAFNSLGIADTAFKDANRKAEDALQEALNNSNTQGYQYARYHYYMDDAKEAMGRAKVSLKTAKQKQEKLKDKMDQANAEFEELNKAHEAALSSRES